MGRKEQRHMESATIWVFERGGVIDGNGGLPTPIGPYFDPMGKITFNHQI